MKLRFIAMTGVMSLAGLGLIGAGAHAVFTQTTTSAQTINAGTPNVQLYSSNAIAGNYTSSLTLNGYGPVGSTFTTGMQDVQIYNAGNIPVSGVSASFSGAGGSGALYNELNVCIEGNSGAVIWQGALSAATGSATISDIGPIAPSGWSNYYVAYYAGAGAVGGNCATSTAASLDNTVEGLSVIPTVTLTFDG